MPGRVVGVTDRLFYGVWALEGLDNEGRFYSENLRALNTLFDLVYVSVLLLTFLDKGFKSFSKSILNSLGDIILTFKSVFILSIS